MSTSDTWDEAAATFDDEPDHGLRDPGVRAAWAERLGGWLPEAPGAVLDLGCGTGSLSLLAAERGHRVTGIDSAPRMLELARRKLADRAAEFHLGNAAEPPVRPGAYDVVLVRHVLWTLPGPEDVLRHWLTLLRPAGRLVLIEGVWGELNPVGIPADRITGTLAPLVREVRHTPLSQDARLWGGPVRDERYAVVALS
ncbi:MULTISPECIES: class I SAM-dependent methyltransferase [unclassified Streptomyces]|uniref:class I SAM-dependent methyltransferase n=1 Tax=unclassified Streptomyces TaxID=2593676 RepID=UPI000DBA2AAD|nr:class I SAM-dependent methyltransferase [Streptomyces sp. PsTaAH-137]MYT72831.1 methyltransferase domain-containing protein [Streptomyces sp. SID8367]RAJ78808.1 methyltransferase family protein [Streptomyces sp. PsTaAH-137]